MFNKNKAKKVEVKHDNAEECAVKINVKPLVDIKEVVTLVNGQKAERVFRVEIGGRDVLTLSPREYNALFVDMLRHKDADELIHDISTVHAEEHAQSVVTSKGAEEILKRVIGSEGFAKVMEVVRR